MKAITAVFATGASVPAIARGRVQRHRDGENEEIQMYLSKLQDLLPYIPKNRKLSKVEVIYRVIDYIRELKAILEDHPEISYQFDAEAVLASMPSPTSLQQPNHRNPLGPRSTPNAIIRNKPSNQENRNQTTPQKQNQRNRRSR